MRTVFYLTKMSIGSNLWDSVLSLKKSPKNSINGRIATYICVLNQISWRGQVVLVEQPGKVTITNSAINANMMAKFVTIAILVCKFETSPDGQIYDSKVTSVRKFIA